MKLSLLNQLDEQILFHCLEDFFIRDEIHSLNTQDYSIAAGGEALSLSSSFLVNVHPSHP